MNLMGGLAARARRHAGTGAPPPTSSVVPPPPPGAPWPTYQPVSLTDLYDQYGHVPSAAEVLSAVWPTQTRRTPRRPRSTMNLVNQIAAAMCGADEDPDCDSASIDVMAARIAEALDVTELPVPMRLNCPTCGQLHLDEGEFATKAHHTHACQHCGQVWRPAIIPTTGVQFLPGFKNDPAPR